MARKYSKARSELPQKFLLFYGFGAGMPPAKINILCQYLARRNSSDF